MDMENDSFSIKAMRFHNRKLENVVLELSLYGFSLDGFLISWDWENTEVVSTIKRFRSGFQIYEKQVFHLHKEGQDDSQDFVVDLDLIDSIKGYIVKLGLKRNEQRKQRELELVVGYRNGRIKKEIEFCLHTEEVLDALNLPSNVRKASGFFLDNPYRILGIPCNATSEEIDNACDKIQRFERLGKISSYYKQSFRLRGIPDPECSLASVHQAQSGLKDIKYKWFWFIENDSLLAWESKDYRDELTRDGLDFGSYDLFLANYFYAVLKDYSFKLQVLWKRICDFFCYLVQEGRNKLYSRFCDTDRISIDVMVSSFKNEFQDSIRYLLETEDVVALLRFRGLIEGTKDDVLQNLLKQADTNITSLFLSKGKEERTFLDNYREEKDLSVARLKEISRHGIQYDEQIGGKIRRMLEMIEAPIRAEMIADSYRNTLWDYMYILNKSEDKSYALIFANKVYSLSDETQKALIRNTFGPFAIKEAEGDVTDQEWVLIGNMFYNGSDDYDLDYEKAFLCYKKAADKGNSSAMNLLGLCCKKGHGTIQNDETADSWFQKASDSGNAEGSYNLAFCYATGTGKQKSVKQAVDIYLLAARQGHPGASSAAQALLDYEQKRQKEHRLSQHEHYDLGFLPPAGKVVFVEIELNYAAYVYLLDDDNYEKYIDCESFSYYGGRITESPHKIKIPFPDFWHLIIDNGDNDMSGIISSVHTRTIDKNA